MHVCGKKHHGTSMSAEVHKGLRFDVDTEESLADASKSQAIKIFNPTALKFFFFQNVNDDNGTKECVQRLPRKIATAQCMVQSQPP